MKVCCKHDNPRIPYRRRVVFDNRSNCLLLNTVLLHRITFTHTQTAHLCSPCDCLFTTDFDVIYICRSIRALKRVVNKQSYCVCGLIGYGHTYGLWPDTCFSPAIGKNVDSLHYVIQESCVMQLLGFGLLCGCAVYFIGILFCLSKTWIINY